MIDIKKSKILLLGAPGSGKGTLSSLLIDKYNLKHISTGNLFRNEVENNGEYASRIKELMVNGQLITDDITNQLAANSILEICNKGEGFILDGYPRTIPQAEFLSKIANIDKVFYLDIDSELLVKRIVGRRICSKCGTNFNIYFQIPKVEGICDKCQSPLIQRKDDNEETLVSRVKEYQNKTSPLIDFYSKQDKLIRIDANKSIDEVLEQVINGLNNDNN